MHSSTIRRTIGIAKVLVAATVLTSVVAATPYRAGDTLVVTRTGIRKPGLTFDIKMSVNAMNPMGAPVATEVMTRGKATADGAYRVDIVSVGTPAPFAVGDYFLMVDKRYVLVRPATKTYVDVMDQSMAAIASLPPEIAAQLAISDVTGKLEKLDDAQSVGGRTTDHHRTSVSYNLSVMGQTMPMTVVTDFWTAKLPIVFQNPFGGQTGTVPTEGPMAPLMKKQQEIMPPLADRTAVKTVSTTTMNMMGQSVVTTISTEMLNIKEGDVDTADMTLPAGFTKAAK